MKKHFSKEDTQMANKHEECASESLDIRNSKFKPEQDVTTYQITMAYS